MLCLQQKEWRVVVKTWGWLRGHTQNRHPRDTSVPLVCETGQKYQCFCSDLSALTRVQIHVEQRKAWWQKGSARHKNTQAHTPRVVLWQARHWLPCRGKMSVRQIINMLLSRLQEESSRNTLTEQQENYFSWVLLCLTSYVFYKKMAKTVYLWWGFLCVIKLCVFASFSTTTHTAISLNFPLIAQQIRLFLAAAPTMQPAAANVVATWLNWRQPLCRLVNSSNYIKSKQCPFFLEQAKWNFYEHIKGSQLTHER